MKEVVKRIDVEAFTSKGDYPGSRFIRIDIRIRTRRTGIWSVNVIQTSGRNPEIHDKISIVGFGNELFDALTDAETRARDANIDLPLLVQAISQAREEVEDELDEQSATGAGHED